MSGAISIFWDNEPGGNVGHLAEHGVTPEEAEQVIRRYFDQREPSRSNPNYWVVEGFTDLGRDLMVVFAIYDEASVVMPITAYEPDRW